MTPLLATKTPSAPAGDKSGGDTRAARSLLSCAFWHGMGRLWRGMGGMGRPEPLSAHRPHQQQGLSGYHETRDTNHGLFRVLRPSGGEKCRLSASVGRSAGFKGGCTKRCVNEWKGVYPNPERKITTFSESGFGSRFGIPHYSSEFVGKIRISPCRPSSASTHAARSLLSCALWSGTGRLWRGMGGRRPPLRNTACWVFAGHESRNMFSSCPPATPRRATPSPAYRVFTNHESRDTNHGFFSNHGLLSASMPCPLVPTIARYCPALLGKKILSRQASARRPAFWLGLTAGLHVSPRGEAKWVRGPSGLGASRAEEKGARRLARAGVLEQYVEHGKQAQRSPGARIACFDRRVVRNAG